MFDTRLYLCSHGFFHGEFVVVNRQRAFSIGDYIEVILRNEPCAIGETIQDLYGKERAVMALPLTVVSCCCATEIDATLLIVEGIHYRHWLNCLNVGVKSVVVSHQMRMPPSGRIWYTPRIDDRLPAILGYQRVPTRSNFT